MTNVVPTVVIATLLHEHGPTGVQTHFNTFRRYLEASGQRVVVVTPFDAPKALVYPIFAIRRLLDPLSGAASVWWYRHWHALFLAWALRRRLTSGLPCIVYAQCPLSARAALQARADSRQRVAMVVHFNRSQADEWSEKGKIASLGWMARRMRALEARTLPALDGIVYVSQFMKRALEERIHGLGAITHAVIPNFCDPVVTQTDPDPVDIINVGTLEPRKNQQFLLHVLAEAARLGKCYSLALIGDGPDRAMLEALANELCISPQVRFLGFRKDAARLMSAAKIYAHAAKMENLPLAIIEAMACGLPVLAPAVGGIPDILQDGRQGYFLPAHASAAARLLIELLENEQLYRDFACAARVRYETEFSTQRVGQRLLAHLCSV